MRNPTIIYCCKGFVHLCYTIWSIHSLRRFNYQPIEMVVSNEKEEAFFTSRCPEVVCSVVDADFQGYRAFSYKPFVLTGYLKESGIQHRGRDVVICDADVLWRHDPAPLFERFRGQNWVHKVTAVNPLDYKIPPESVPTSYISLRTIQNYAKRYGVSVYPNFVVNAGLFMLPESVFPKMLKAWMNKILELPAGEMLMSEALMALTYAEMGLSPISDREDIKHLGIERSPVDVSVVSFETAELPQGMFTGYQTARHYFGDQRKQLHKDAIKMKLDSDYLLPIIRKEIILKNIKSLPKAPGKILRKIKNILQ